MYISNSTNFQNPSNVVYTDRTAQNNYNSNKGIITIQSLSNNHFGRYVTVEMNEVKKTLVICEIEIFAGKWTYYFLTSGICMLLSSADNICKQF